MDGWVQPIIYVISYFVLGRNRSIKIHLVMDDDDDDDDVISSSIEKKIDVIYFH